MVNSIKEPYSCHPSYLKMIKNIKKKYYCLILKKEIVKYITKCLNCQQVKVQCRHLARLLQTIPIHNWKWEVISMDSITRLEKTIKKLRHYGSVVQPK